MNGSVDDCDLDSAKTRRNSAQSSLHEYSEVGSETFVAIVNSPNDEMESAVDEIDQRLAPSKRLFTEWIETRDEFRDHGLSYTDAHNQAFNSVNYRKRFLQEVTYDAFDEYGQRIIDGENIVFVCYCSNGCKCHRKIVKEHVYNAAKMADDDV